VKKAESAKVILTPKIQQELVQIKLKAEALVSAADWIEDELVELSVAADNLLQLLEVDTSHGGPIGC
jgi:phosphohistidine swiveling domain-containing protein